MPQFNEKKKTLYRLNKKVFDLLDDKLENVCKNFLEQKIIKDFRYNHLKKAFKYLRENSISFNFDDEGTSMNYNDGLICQQYMLRYTMAYAFEYYVMYRIALKQLGESPRVYSFGCGSGLDCLSLAYAKVKLNYDKEVNYRGIDLTEWDENFDLNDLPGINAEKRVDKNEGMLAFLKEESDYMPNILFFPKILSELKDDTLTSFCELLKDNSDKLSDELIVCVSYRSCETKEYDLKKTNQIIKALEGNNYKRQTLVDLDDMFKNEIQLETDEDNVIKFNYDNKKKQYRNIDGNFKIPEDVFRSVGAGIKDICAKTVNKEDKNAICNECNYKKQCEEQCPKSAMVYVKDMCFQIIRLEKKSDK